MPDRGSGSRIIVPPARGPQPDSGSGVEQAPPQELAASKEPAFSQKQASSREPPVKRGRASPKGQTSSQELVSPPESASAQEQPPHSASVLEIWTDPQGTSGRERDSGRDKSRNRGEDGGETLITIAGKNLSPQDSPRPQGGHTPQGNHTATHLQTSCTDTPPLITRPKTFEHQPGNTLLDDYLNHAMAHDGMKPVISVDGTGRRAYLVSHAPYAQGYVSMQMFESGIMAGSALGRLLAPYTALYEENFYLPHLALTMKLSGRFEWMDLRGREYHTEGEQELWFQSGMMDWRHATMLPGDWEQFHIAMEASTIERWLADGMLHDNARRLLEQCLQPRPQGAMQVNPMPADMTALMQQALALVTNPQPMAPVPLALQLQMEGTVLTLLGQWLQLPPTPMKRRQDRWRRAVDDAIDIIHSEYQTELSISRLAWRVGTNECYLKQGFRERTGMGVAAYLRQQRMKVALALLEEGKWSIKDVAHYVGYRSLGHFSQAFRTVHGHLPSEVQTEARTRTGTGPDGEPSTEEA